MGPLHLCVVSYSAFPSKEIQARKKTRSNSRFAIKVAQTQVSCVWRVKPEPWLHLPKAVHKALRIGAYGEALM